MQGEEIAAGPWQGAAAGEDGRENSAVATPREVARRRRAWRRADLRDTAIHEAGHAVTVWWHMRRRLVPCNWDIGVVAVHRHRRRRFVVQGEERDWAAGTTTTRRLLWRDEDYAAIRDRAHRRFVLRCRLAELAMVYAGPIAEARNTGEGWLDEFDWRLCVDDPESCTDLQRVEGTIPKLGRRWRAHLDHAWRRADGIVDGHWRQIGKLAAALLQRREIDGETAFEICERAGRALPIGAQP
jgi:hypothetical protein